MAQTISDIMTTEPVTLDASESIQRAAREMRERDVGNVVVAENGKVRGIVTDRDIVVRAVAEGSSPDQVTLRDVCSSDLTTVSPDTDLAEAARLMREKSLRRLPVMRDDRVVGIVSIGDMAIERDPESALGDISAAQGNT